MLDVLHTGNYYCNNDKLVGVPSQVEFVIHFIYHKNFPEYM